MPTRREVGAEELPKEDCEDEQEWLIEIEELSYLILWDYEKLGTATYFSTPKTTIPINARNSAHFREIIGDVVRISIKNGGS